MDELEIRPAAGANKVDDLILQYVDSHSPEAISQMLGGVVSPARIRLRAQELVRTADWLTEAEQDKVVMLKLRRVLAELEGRYLDVDNAKLRLAFLREIGGRLEKRRAATDTDLNTLYANQGRIMGRIFDMALSYMSGAFREQIDPVRWAAAKKEALKHANAELQKYELDA